MLSASGSGNDIRPNKTRRNPNNMTPPADDGTAKPQKKTGTGEEGVALEHLRPVSQTTLPGKVASRIREMVSTGTVKPGERIPSERALAEQLGVGRPAIREALQELKTQGVLVSGRGPQGTRVATSPLSKIGTSLAQLLGSGAEHVRELMQLRASVEIEAAGLAAHRASLEDIRRLADSVVKPGEVTTAHIDVSFHLAIARATHNALFSQIAQEIINLLHEHTQAVLDALYNQPGGVMAIQRQHEAVVQAIRLGNEDRAREEMRTHMQYVTKGLAELTGYGESIRLIIADLDGTLLESPKVITERTKKTVAAVHKVVLDIRDLEEDKEKEARDMLRRHFDGRAHITETVPGLIDMISADASKAVMAQRLARSLGLTADQVMGIGDHENDVPLLRWAGLGVAMGNAVPAAKEAADVVTSSNKRDGVAEALERWVLDRPKNQTPF